MRSAVLFLPRCITFWMKRWTVTLLNFASGGTGLLTTRARRGIALFSCWTKGQTDPGVGESGLLLPKSRPLVYKGPAGKLCLGACSGHALGAVFAPPLLAVTDARGVECASNNVVPHTRQVLHPSSPNEHHRVLLKG